MSLTMSEFSGAGVVVFKASGNVLMERSAFKSGQHALVAVAMCDVGISDCTFEVCGNDCVC